MHILYFSHNKLTCSPFNCTESMQNVLIAASHNTYFCQLQSEKIALFLSYWWKKREIMGKNGKNWENGENEENEKYWDAVL